MSSTIAARVLFALSLLGALGAANALWRPDHDRSWVFRPWWLFAVLTGELVPLRIAAHGLVVVILSFFGALDHRAGDRAECRIANDAARAQTFYRAAVSVR